MKPHLRRLACDRSGASALMTTLMLPVLLGFTVLAADGGMAYVTRRTAQSAADSAAHSAAVALGSGDGNALDQVRGVALQYGLKDGTDGVSIRVDTPPASGVYAGNAKAVQVTITRPMLTFFSQIFGGSPSTMTVRSVSLIGRPGDICVLALHPTKTWAVTVNGSPVVDLADCVLQINSTASQGLLVNGPADVTANQIRLAGAGYLLNGGPTMNLANGYKVNADPVDDPYADIAPPALTPCKSFNAPPSSGNWTAPTSPGGVTTYCTTMIVNGSPTVNFPAGTYIFANGADLIVNGSPTVNGDRITFVFAKSGTSTGGFTLNGLGKVTLRAPTTGPLAGLMVFTDPSVTSQPNAIINGSNTSHFTGAIHLPKANVTINGSNAVNGECLQLVARDILFNGSGTFGLDCSGVGVRPIGAQPSTLVE